PIIEHKYIGREVDGKDILIVDDMIASGGSVIDIAKQLKKQNAKRIFCAVSFALFTEGPDKFDQMYNEGFINGVYSTNLTYVPESIKNKEWFHAVDMSELMSEFIHHINREESISILLDKTRGINIL
ncbi:phosphoribosyltransferase family protein, partial [Finegoldia magna]